MQIDLAIKFGSNEIIIYRKGLGIVAKQPAYLAVSEEGNKTKVKAFGKKAEDLFASGAANVSVFQPIINSEVVNESMANILMSEILKDVLADNFLLTRVNALVAVPCLLNEKQLLTLKRVLHSSGINKISFVRNAVAARANLDLDPHANVMIVDIGKHITEIAVLNEYAISFGRTYFVGGSDMDKSIVTFVSDNHNLKIDLKTAESLKNEVASLYDRDLYKAEFIGVLDNGKFKKDSVTANEVRLAITNIYAAVVQLIEKVIKELTENRSDIYNNGIMFIGGASEIPGLYEYLTQKLELPIIIPDSPSDAAILGAGKLLASNVDFLRV